MAPRQDIKKVLEVGQEASFETAPGTYHLVKTTQTGLGRLNHQPTFSENSYATGRARRSQNVFLQDLTTLDVELEMIPLSVAVDVGESPGTDDGLDDLLSSAFGNPTDFPGAGAAASTSTTYNPDVGEGDDLDPGDLVAPYESGVNSSRAQPRLITEDDGAGPPPAYTIHRAWDENLSTAAVAFGHRDYRPVDAGGPSLGAHYVDDDTTYTLGGGRFVPQTLMIPAGGLATFKGQLQFNTIAQSGSLSNTVTSGTIITTAQTPLKGVLGSVEFNSTAYSNVASVEISWNTQTTPLGSISGTHGRGDIENLVHLPSLTINFTSTDTWRAAMVAETTGPLLVRIGTGTHDASNDIMPMWVFYAHAAQVKAVGNDEDGGRRRNSVQLDVIDAGQVGSTTPTIVPAWGLARF